MATNLTIRRALTALIAEAIRTNEDYTKSPEEVAALVVQATGMRRAIWAALTPRQRQVLITRARARAGAAD